MTARAKVESKLLRLAALVIRTARSVRRLELMRYLFEMVAVEIGRRQLIRVEGWIGLHLNHESPLVQPTAAEIAGKMQHLDLPLSTVSRVASPAPIPVKSILSTTEEV